MEAGASLMSCSNPAADTTTSDKVVAVAVAVAVVAAYCAPTEAHTSAAAKATQVRWH